MAQKLQYYTTTIKKQFSKTVALSLKNRYSRAKPVITKNYDNLSK